VGAEVEQRATAGRARSDLRRQPLEARLETDDVAQRPTVDEGSDGEEVGVPAPVLVRRQGEAQPLGELHRAAGGGRVERERLVADHREAHVQRLFAERRVRVGRGRDRDRLRPGGLHLGDGRERSCLGVLGRDQRLSLRRGGYHPEEVTLRCSGEQGSVEVPPPEAVADQAEADGLHRRARRRHSTIMAGACASRRGRLGRCRSQTRGVRRLPNRSLRDQ
jgi:hypothetical protein